MMLVKRQSYRYRGYYKSVIDNSIRCEQIFDHAIDAVNQFKKDQGLTPRDRLTATLRHDGDGLVCYPQNGSEVYVITREELL